MGGAALQRCVNCRLSETRFSAKVYDNSIPRNNRRQHILCDLFYISEEKIALDPASAAKAANGESQPQR